MMLGAASCFLHLNVYSQIQMPAAFTDGLVLQQNSNVPVWGWGNPAEKMSVVASWATADTVKTVVDNQGKWKVDLPTAKAGGPYTIEVIGAYETKKINDVMLGEVWLCSGQSNMEWSANMWIMNCEEEIKNADCNNVRILHLPKQGADTPQADARTKWEVSSPETMRRTSATAYFFARYLTEKLNVPVGIIVSAWGGTPAEVWTPAEVIAADKVLAANKLKEYEWWPIKPGVLFNQMINPVIPYKLAGCIWYQGESNHENASSYSHLMTKMVEAWRERFDQDFPFYYVQIAPHTYNSKQNTPALLREQQELMLKSVPGSGMINISDLVENVKDIHPRNKRAIGERLAFMVMDKEYGQFTQPYESPYLKSAVRKGRNVVIDFGGNFEKLVSVSKQIVGVKVSDADGNLTDVKAKIKGKQLVVPVGKVKAPLQVMYCFDDATIGSLRTEGGLPVLPFRTDKIVEK